MTDEQIPEPDFDDPSYDELRALLSDAKVEGPIPVDVAARLDATLAELTGRPRAEDRVVVPLRRRLAPRLLAAAAVVLVAGAGAVGLNHLVQDSSGTSDSAVAGSRAADSGTGTAPEAAPTLPAQPQQALGGKRSYSTWGSVPVLTTADFTTQASALKLSSLSTLDSVTALSSTSGERRGTTSVPTPTASGDGVVTSSGSSSRTFDESARRTAKAALSCPGPRLKGTVSYPIVLDNRPAVLVVHPAQDGSRLYQAWSCDGSRVLAFTTVTG